MHQRKESVSHTYDKHNLGIDVRKLKDSLYDPNLIHAELVSVFLGPLETQFVDLSFFMFQNLHKLLYCYMTIEKYFVTNHRA